MTFTNPIDFFERTVIADYRYAIDNLVYSLLFIPTFPLYLTYTILKYPFITIKNAITNIFEIKIAVALFIAHLVIIIPSLVINLLSYYFHMALDFIKAIGNNFNENFLINRTKTFYADLLLSSNDDKLMCESYTAIDITKDTLKKFTTFILAGTPLHLKLDIAEVFKAINILNIDTIYLDNDIIRNDLNKLISNLNSSCIKRVIIYDDAYSLIYLNLIKGIDIKEIIIRLPIHRHLENLSSDEAYNRLIEEKKIHSIELFVPVSTNALHKKIFDNEMKKSDSIIKKIIVKPRYYIEFYRYNDYTLFISRSTYRDPRYNNYLTITPKSLLSVIIENKYYKNLEQRDFKNIFETVASSNITTFYYPSIIEEAEQKKYFLDNISRTNIVSPIGLFNKVDKEISNALRNNLKKQKDLLIGIGLMFARNNNQNIPFNVSLNILLFLYGDNIINEIAYDNEEYLSNPMENIIEESCKLYWQKNNNSNDHSHIPGHLATSINLTFR